MCLSRLFIEPLGRIDADMVNKKAFPGGGQPFIKTGIRVYDDMTIAQGSFSGQIFACGDLMEGYDWVYERSGAGVAAASRIPCRKECGKYGERK